MERGCRDTPPPPPPAPARLVGRAPRRRRALLGVAEPADAAVERRAEPGLAARPERMLSKTSTFMLSGTCSALLAHAERRRPARARSFGSRENAPTRGTRAHRAQRGAVVARHALAEPRLEQPRRHAVELDAPPVAGRADGRAVGRAVGRPPVGRVARVFGRRAGTAELGGAAVAVGGLGGGGAAAADGGATARSTPATRPAGAAAASVGGAAAASASAGAPAAAAPAADMPGLVDSR